MINKEREHQIVLKRYINENDYKIINELQELCIKEDKVNLKLELDYKLKLPKNYEKSFKETNEYLYYINDKLAAYLGISSFDGNTAEINGMVHPVWRRRGIFTKLCSLAIEESIRRNFNKILLLCDDKSVSAKEFIKTMKVNYAFSEVRMKAFLETIDDSKKDIKLIKASNEDIEQIKEIDRLSFGIEKANIILPEDEEKYNNTITYLIKLKEIIIGKIRVEREEKKAFITGFGITPEFRARGYGRQALSTILNLLNKEDIFWAELDVEVKNKGALKLYTSCGFKEESIMNYYEYRG